MFRTCGDNGGLRTNGTPCKRIPAPGHTRCNLHGAVTAGSKLKAELALAISRMPAIEALHDIIEQFQANTCAACGFPKGDADEKRLIVTTAKVILDRTGFGPHSTVSVAQQSDGGLDVSQLTDDERAELVGIFARVAEIKAAVRARMLALVGGMGGDDHDDPPVTVTH